MLRIKKKIKIIQVELKQYRNLKYKQKKKENLKKIIGGNKMKKYYAARQIIRRKLINDDKLAHINTELEKVMSLINNNWDTFGWINTDQIAELFDIPLQRGVSNTKITEDISNMIEEIHDRNSFCSCLR